MGCLAMEEPQALVAEDVSGSLNLSGSPGDDFRLTYLEEGFGRGVATSRLIYTPAAPREADRLMDSNACWVCSRINAATNAAC